MTMSTSSPPGPPTHYKIQMQVVPTPAGDTTHLGYDDDEFSDFGADPEELAAIEQLLQEAAAKKQQQLAAHTATATATAPAPSAVIDIEDYAAPQALRLPEASDILSRQEWNLAAQTENREPQSSLVQIVCDESVAVKAEDQKQRDEVSQPSGQSPPPEDANAEPAEPTTPQKDTRSPLERFRKPPKKTMSVTDLTSPAWCELQYFYILSSKTGRKKPTAAMKQGTTVHKVLEEEVHVTIPVQITKREDNWGLKVWNIIQGLRTLRETGRTREFEVWGTVGGELVNGVIDELSYDCPDPKLEEQSLKLMGKQNNEPPIPEYQTSIREFLVSSEHREQSQTIADALTSNNSEGKSVTTSSNREKRIYITDVKTRGVSSLPTGSSLRPTVVQLHLYHHLLENFAQGNFPLELLAQRFKFDVNETFSDSFIAQIGNLNQEAFDRVTSSLEDGMDIDYDEDEFLPSTQDSIDIILQHNNISSLWQYMLGQFEETFIARSSGSSTLATQSQSTSEQNGNEPPSSTPHSISSLDFPPQTTLPTLLSPLLTAQYLSSKLKSTSDPSKPRLLGSKSIIFNPSFLRSYLYDSLAFWRGEREPKGVVLSDTWKCRVCEFRDDCDWLKAQDQRILNESLERRRTRAEVVDGGVAGEDMTRSHV